MHHIRILSPQAYVITRLQIHSTRCALIIVEDRDVKPMGHTTNHLIACYATRVVQIKRLGDMEPETGFKDQNIHMVSCMKAGYPTAQQSK